MNRYNKIINKFSAKKVLVIGDLILDHYIWGKVSRISPEAPVPVVDVTKESFMLGGAANVAHNVVALGAKASVIGLRGDDMAGDGLVRMLSDKGVDCDGVMVSDRPTTVKTRVIAHSQQVVRFDREDRAYVDGEMLRKLLSRIKAEISGFDAIIISDYKKGMVTPELIRGIVRCGRGRHSSGTFIAVDPKMGHFDYYKGVSLITPNVMEASDGAGIEITDEKSLLEAGNGLLKRLGCKVVLITRGEQGMSVFERNSVMHIPTVARKVYDVTGAGDTVISAYTLACASGATMEEAAVIANHAAGIVVGEVGTAVATPKQIMESFQ